MKHNTPTDRSSPFCGRGSPLTRLRFSPIRRSGISIIEVLISIVVATIGVFGVFALIPFAIRQAEIGINEEAAITLARNGISDFENQGCSSPTRWAIPDFRDDNGVGGTTDYLPPFDGAFTGSAPTLSAGVYCIDPWGWQNRDPAAVDSFDLSPYTDFGGPFPFMRRISLFQTPTTFIPPPAFWPTVFGRADARNVFGSPDDVVVNVQKDAFDLEYPAQTYFTGGARQYTGKTSWQIFVAASPGSIDDVHFYTVVFQNRDTNADRAAADDTGRLYDRLFRVEMPAGAGPQFQIGGGDLRIRELSTPLVSDTAIRRGSWMMLLGSNDSATDPVIQTIGFYRVIESDLVPGAPPPPEYDVSLQGGDFTLTASTTSIGDSTHYAVLLPDVLTVHERTMRIPTSSNWN